MTWTDEQIQEVWDKGQLALGNAPANIRKDQCGAWIRRGDHGNRQSEYGWEIDHISPGGSHAIGNLRPLHWKNNLDKSDGRLKCNIKAFGTRNVDYGIGD